MCLRDSGEPDIKVSLDPSVLSPGCLGDVDDGGDVCMVSFL